MTGGHDDVCGLSRYS